MVGIDWTRAFLPGFQCRQRQLSRARAARAVSGRLVRVSVGALVKRHNRCDCISSTVLQMHCERSTAAFHNKLGAGDSSKFC